MVCFVRKDILQILLDKDSSEDLPSLSINRPNCEVVFPIEKFNYELLFSKVFPYSEETRTMEERILDDVKYFINRHLYEDDPFFDEEKNIFQFPIETIFSFVHDATDTNELRAIIRKEFVINDNDCVEHNMPEPSDSEQSNSDDGQENSWNQYQNPANDGDGENWD